MRSYRTEVFTGIVVCIVVLMLSTAYAGANKLRVAYTDWYPYTYNENGVAAGFEIESFDAVISQMRLEAEYVQYPWNRCLKSLEHGQVDALISLLKTPERERYTYYLETSISISKTMLFITLDKAISFSGSYRDLEGYSIGVITGFSYGEAFDNADYLTKDGAEDVQMLITKLLKGRNDVAVENQVVVKASALKMGVQDQLGFLEPPIHTQKLYVGFSKANNLESLCTEFSEALHEFKNTDAYAAILGKYGILAADMLAPE